MIAFGLERASDDDLKMIRKGLTTDNIINVIAQVFEAGIAPVGLFMYGFVNETYESLSHLIEFAEHLPLLRCRFTPLYPLPCTAIRQEIDEKKLWLDDKFKESEYAIAETPVIKNQVAKDIESPGYQVLNNFEKTSLRKIYGSKEYGERVMRFNQISGGRFSHFFNTTWKQYVMGDLVGTTPKW